MFRHPASFVLPTAALAALLTLSYTDPGTLMAGPLDPEASGGPEHEAAALSDARESNTPLELSEPRRWHWLLWTLSGLVEEQQDRRDVDVGHHLVPFGASSEGIRVIGDEVQPSHAGNPYTPFGDSSAEPTLTRVAQTSDQPGVTPTYEPFDAAHGADDPEAPTPSAGEPETVDELDTTTNSGSYQPFDDDIPSPSSTSSPAPVKSRSVPRGAASDDASEVYRPFGESPRSESNVASRRSEHVRADLPPCPLRWSDHAPPTGCEISGARPTSDVALAAHLLRHPLDGRIRDVELSIEHDDQTRRWTLVTPVPVAPVSVALDGAAMLELTAAPPNVDAFGPLEGLERVLITAAHDAPNGVRAAALRAMAASCDDRVRCHARALDMDTGLSIVFVHVVPRDAERNWLYPEAWRFQMARGTR